MTLRELINQVTDNDSESPALDYEIHIVNPKSDEHFYLFLEKVKTNDSRQIILEVE